MANNQQQVSGGGADGEDETTPGTESGAGQVHLSTAGTDDLLDEIDGLLENNAEEFVKSYVQKGGQ